MSDPSGSKEWTEQLTQCILGATLRSARNNELYLLLLHCASRQPVDASLWAEPGEVVDPALRERLAAEFAALTAQFFGNLLQLTCNTREPAPEFTPADPLRWHDELTNYTSRNGLRELREMLATCGGAASADGARDQAERVRNFGKAYFDFIGGAARIGAIMEREYTDRLLARLERARSAATVLECRGLAGGLAAADLWVANTGPERARISARVPELRRADGVGPAFAPPVEIEPGNFALDPSQEASVHLIMRLDAMQFMPDALYVGHVLLSRSDEPEVRIPLRVIAQSAAVRP